MIIINAFNHQKSMETKGGNISFTSEVEILLGFVILSEQTMLRNIFSSLSFTTLNVLATKNAVGL